MIGTLKWPLLTTTAALALVLGTMSSQADSPAPDSGDAKSDQAEQHAPAAASDKVAEASNPADDADDTSTVDAGDQEVSTETEAPDDAEADAEVASDVASVEADSEDGGPAVDDGVTDDNAVARSKSFTKSIVTPHMAMSITRSIGLAKDEDGDMAMAKAMAKAKALDTPGQTRTDTMTKTSVRVEGDAEADATASAEAEIGDGGMTVETFGETSVAVH
jgi:hypothetical protein